MPTLVASSCQQVPQGSILRDSLDRLPRLGGDMTGACVSGRAWLSSSASLGYCDSFVCIAGRLLLMTYQVRAGSFFVPVRILALPNSLLPVTCVANLFINRTWWHSCLGGQVVWGRMFYLLFTTVWERVSNIYYQLSWINGVLFLCVHFSCFENNDQKTFGE